MFNETPFFFFLFFFSLVFSIFVVFSKNPVYSVLSLVLVFINVTGLLILLGVDFLSMLFLVVYVGAVAVLFLFVVMMLNIKILSFYSFFFRYFPLTVLFLLYFFFPMLSNLIYLDLHNLLYNLYFNPINCWSCYTFQVENIFVLGSVLYTFYFCHFLFCGVILFIAMLGAISLTLHKRTDVKKQQIFKQLQKNFYSNIIWRK